MAGFHISVTTENEDQFLAVLKSGRADLVYIDSAYTDPGDFSRLVKAACEHNVLCGLRLPHIWRTEAGRYFTAHLEEIREAGFSRWLFRNMESALWFETYGLLDGVQYSTDHGIYLTNQAAVKEVLDMLPDGGAGIASLTCPLELNGAELRDLIRGSGFTASGGAAGFEMVVYGRAPMMVSAQCLQKNLRGCRKGNETVLILQDRKGAGMPVRNSCRFCFNTIYNAVPAMIYDLTEEVEDIGAGSLRYEFTTETPEEVLRILNGEVLPTGSFTRGHFRKSVL